MPRVGDKHYPYTAKGQAAAKAAAKRKGVVRGRMWRTNWMREVRREQCNPGNSLKFAPFSRLVRELDADMHGGTSHRWTTTAINALREETQDRMTKLMATANAITLAADKVMTCGCPVNVFILY